MSNSRQDKPTQWLLVGTIAAVLVVIWMLWGSGLFRPQGHYLGLDDLEHVGAFIGGVFTPIAVGWAARTFLLQREQMIDTLDVMQQQNELARRAVEQTNEQIRIDREREIVKSDPQFQVTWKALPDNPYIYSIKITNHGETAQSLAVSFRITDADTKREVVARKERRLDAMKKDEFGYSSTFMVSLDDMERSTPNCDGEIDVLAERLDGLISKYTFKSENGGVFVRTREERAIPRLKIDDDG